MSPQPGRATAATQRLLIDLLDASLFRGRPHTAAEIVVGRIVVRLLDAGLSLRAVEASGPRHPQRKLDGRRALLVEDLDGFAAALGISVGELLEPSVTEAEAEALENVEACTSYSADGDVIRGADLHTAVGAAGPFHRLAIQGLIDYCPKGGHIVTPAGARCLPSLP